MRFHLVFGGGAGRSDSTLDPDRRRLVACLALSPLVLALPGCGDPSYCQVSWYAGPSDACLTHDFAPGDVVMRGVAEAGEHEIIVRNRLAAGVLTPEQQDVIFDLLVMEVDGELVSFSERGGHVFAGGERVTFRLMDFEFVVDVDSEDGTELSQLELFDESVVLTDPPDRTDPEDLGYQLGFVVIRGGAVHEPGPDEFVADANGVERFTPQPGDRLVYLNIDHLPAAV